MVQTLAPNSSYDILRAAISSGAIVGDPEVLNAKLGQMRSFQKRVDSFTQQEEDEARECFEELARETRIGREAGVLDEGQDEYYNLNGYDSDAEMGWERLDTALSAQGLPQIVVPSSQTCFATLCRASGATKVNGVRSVNELSEKDRKMLSGMENKRVEYTVYTRDNERNHVELAQDGARVYSRTNKPPHDTNVRRVAHGVMSFPEFFSSTAIYADTMFYAGVEDPMPFGGDRHGGMSDFRAPQAPQSVIDGQATGGASNTSGGVVRPARRVVKARGHYAVDNAAVKSYGVTGVTMFNNVDELYLNSISREYAQEIVEDLFSVWELPTEEPSTMQYAEDLLWLFLIARTASNKADYRAEFEVPTSVGAKVVQMQDFSLLLSDKYGITRRNFSRAVANDLRAYLNRMENQFIKTKSASRVGADPQYGDLCFDGSTGCSGTTSSEASFAKLLEGRNLYERDDVIAEGASDRLMQGLHGGVRSVVPR